MEALKLIKEFLSDTPLPTIIAVVGLAALVISFAEIKFKPFVIKVRPKLLRTPLVIGAILVGIAIVLYSFTSPGPPPGEVTTPTQTELVASSPTVQASPSPPVTPSETPVVAPTNTPSPTIEPTPTLTPTPLPPTPTPTPKILFQDTFIDNKNRWQLISQARGPTTPGIETNIYGGKFVITVDCPATYKAATCAANIPVPYVMVKNFYMEFETSIKRMSQEANVIIGVQYRRSDASYYWFQYKDYGTFLFSLILKGKTLPLSEETLSPSINTDSGAVNIIGVYAKDSTHILYANGTELVKVEDGNLSQAGGLYIKFHVARNNSATIELDNLTIRDTP